MSSRSDVYSFPYLLMLADRLYWNASYTIALSFSKYKTSRKFSTACSHCRNYFLIAVYVVLERTQQVCLVIHLFSFSNCLFFFFFSPSFPSSSLPFCRKGSFSVGLSQLKWNNRNTLHGSASCIAGIQKLFQSPLVALVIFYPRLIYNAANASLQPAGALLKYMQKHTHAVWVTREYIIRR